MQASVSVVMDCKQEQPLRFDLLGMLFLVMHHVT
jgi:hypothetical protein